MNKAQLPPLSYSHAHEKIRAPRNGFKAAITKNNDHNNNGLIGINKFSKSLYIIDSSYNVKHPLVKEF